MASFYTNVETPEGIEETLGKNHVLKEKEVRVLDSESLEKVRKFTLDRLGKVVFRYVYRIDAKAPVELFLRERVHSENEKSNPGPKYSRVREEEFDNLPEEKKNLIESRCRLYSFVTHKNPAAPYCDDYKGKPIFASSNARAELDPVTLKFIKVKNAAKASMPWETKTPYKNPTPWSLVCGRVVYNFKTKRLEFAEWCVASIQLMRAVVHLTDPRTQVPEGQDEVKSPLAYRSHVMTGNRILTNEYRRVCLSETPKRGAEPNLTEEDHQRHFKMHIGEKLGEANCHTLAFWVLLVKYGELPTKDTIPVSIPMIPPKNPALLAKYYQVKSIKFWDLPFLPLGGKVVRLDEYLVVSMGLKSTLTKKFLAVNVRSLEVAEELSLRSADELSFVDGSSSLRPVSSPIGSCPKEIPADDTLNSIGDKVADEKVIGLDQDTDESSRAPTPTYKVEVRFELEPGFAWADVEDEEMDYDASSAFFASTPLTSKSMASASIPLTSESMASAS